MRRKCDFLFLAVPLLVVALSGPVLGERIGWRRWAAVAAGFAGILIILQPGVGVFSPWAILPLISALMFAIYGLLTRMDSAFSSTSTAHPVVRTGSSIRAYQMARRTCSIIPGTSIRR